MSLLKPLQAYDHVVVLGAGRSGIAAAQLLLREKASVELCDDKKEQELSYFSASPLNDAPGLLKSFGGKESMLSAKTWGLILSPGVAFDHPLVKRAQSLSIPLLNEIDLALLYMPRIKTIGITGTNGKSTTTVMIENILHSAGLKAWAGGNLGQPLCDRALAYQKDPFDFAVLELSSFQLETLKHLRLDIAIILNITPDHLDRYKSLAEYTAAKFNIIKLLTNDGLLLYNKDIAINANINPKIKHEPFSSELFATNTLAMLKDVSLKGEHNKENAVAAALCARHLDIDDSAIAKGLVSFKPLAHRCEQVALKNGISFINDSKGTTVEAVKKALSMTNTPVHLLLGGLSKGEDFISLAPSFFPQIKNYYVFGQAQTKILSDLANAPSSAHDNLEQAFKSALQNAQSGDTILLSPGCASYDQFKNFMERGELFRALVNDIK